MVLTNQIIWFYLNKMEQKKITIANEQKNKPTITRGKTLYARVENDNVQFSPN
jgi:hypothetical protein